jgi:hypothetical protein
MFERILNTFTVIFLDLTPKINDTINPMSIKTYKKIGIHRFIFGDLNTKKINNATKNIGYNNSQHITKDKKQP